MALPLEDYALIGDCETAALVGNDGSIDWLCLPRFDSGACCAALLGDVSNGRWLLAPADPVREVHRRYRDDTLVLETEFVTDRGSVRIVDCMPPLGGRPDVVRLVQGVRGRVAMRMELVVRFDYGRSIPWVLRDNGRLRLIAGPDALVLDTPVATRGKRFTTVAEFSVAESTSVPFVLTWHESHRPVPPRTDAEAAVEATTAWWQHWSGRRRYSGAWPQPVARSLITLKALTYSPTGGIVAAPTTSLPEELGGSRNWDYRYCWVRDATFTLYALLLAGYAEEAKAWREWLLRAIAGAPDEMQIMYGPAGERRLTELEVPWLAGYEGSRPVRIGNGAVNQFQLDLYGEVMDALYQSRRAGVATRPHEWEVQRVLMDFLESAWQRPDEGIWEVRGPRRHFTHSKVMAWVAADRAVKTVEQTGERGPAERWRLLRAAIHDEVCRRAWDSERATFTQYYGSRQLDAAVLMMPLVGFLEATDERMVSTVAAIERELNQDGFVRRYSHPDATVDGLAGSEGAFLPCTFWLADNYAMMGRAQEATEIFEHLLGLANDVGLLAEEYDVQRQRLVGNFPQAFTHVSLVNTALNLSTRPGPAEHRPVCGEGGRPSGAGQSKSGQSKSRRSS
jgi:GH15 family glucan-1,4-alpha-glucosidase